MERYDMSQTIQSSHWSPLTPAQLDFWEEFTFHPHQPVSTVAHCITLRGAINERALLAALQQVIKETPCRFSIAIPTSVPTSVLSICNSGALRRRSHRP